MEGGNRQLQDGAIRVTQSKRSSGTSYVMLIMPSHCTIPTSIQRICRAWRTACIYFMSMGKLYSYLNFLIRIDFSRISTLLHLEQAKSSPQKSKNTKDVQHIMWLQKYQLSVSLLSSKRIDGPVIYFRIAEDFAC